VTVPPLPSLPLVSIGVFLYNEERFVHESIAALLAQDYPNLEIIVSDNCSTDNTFAICQSLCTDDSRVTLTRQEENVGVAKNSIAVLDAANGKYFMWASGHDLWSPNLISDCVAALESLPDAALAYPASGWIDAQGQSLPLISSTYDTRGSNPITRFFTVFWGNAHPVLGLLRTEYLRRFKVLACAGADQIVLAELAMMGDSLHVPGAMWHRREFRTETTHGDKLKRYKSAEFNLTGSWFDRTFPLARLPIELVRIVACAPIDTVQKLIVLLALPGSFIARLVAGKQR
jgi:glycosyltransferase involved in cell wall biosynthesis